MIDTLRLAEIVAYAGDIIEVNPEARRDFELLMERVDDEHQTECMGREDQHTIEQAISDKYFGGAYVEEWVYQKCTMPAVG